MTVVRGWCPSAHRPMASGDGLIVRVRPRMARMTAPEVMALCDLSERYGSGILDLTSRANLQIRGVKEADHPALLGALIEAGLVAADPAREASVTVSPFWMAGDPSDRLGQALEPRLAELPDLPGKMSIVLDAGSTRWLSEVSGDFRLERAKDGGVLLRADGAPLGRPVDEGGAIDALLEMADWFVRTGGAAAGRMRRHLARTALPAAWQSAAPSAAEAAPGPDPAAGRLAWAFGQMTAESFREIIGITDASEVRFTPWRSVVLRKAEADISVGLADISAWTTDISAVIADASDPLLRVEACPGAPYCTQATVATRPLARALARRVPGRLHVSGCAKSCATQSPAEVTLIGRDGRFDLVENGRPGDTPRVAGLTQDAVKERFA